MVHEFLPALVNPVNVTVDVDSVAVRPVIWLVDVKLVKAFANLNFIDVFGDVDHLCSVLHKATVLSFRGLVGAQSAPLGGVKVSCFEVRLTSDQGRSDTTHVRECSKVGGSVEQLAHTGAAADPVTRSEGVHDFAGQHVGSKARGDFQLTLAVVMALELVLEVAGELSGRNTEQVLNEVAGQANALVGVVVLVVGVSAFDGHFQDLANDSAHVNGLLFSVFGLVAKVREQFTVEELAHTSLTVFLLLTCSEFLLEPLVAFFHGFNAVFLVVFDFVDVGNDVLERVRVAGNGLEDVLVVFNAKGSHQQHDGDGRGACG